MIDVHAHIDFPQFDPDRKEVIERAKDEGIGIVCSGIGPESIGKTLELAETYLNIHATLGLSPTEFESKVIDGTIELIRKNSGRIVGIGEVGLDYYWVKEEDKRGQEKTNFKRFIDLSLELQLPLVIHSRDAEQDTLDMLEEAGIKALLHCFSGTVEQALHAAEYGHIISIPTNICYSRTKQKLAKALPLESVVLETDAPYLSPVPKTRNEPINIKKSAEKIAELKGVTFDEVAEITAGNARRFFGI